MLDLRLPALWYKAVLLLYLHVFVYVSMFPGWSFIVNLGKEKEKKLIYYEIWDSIYYRIVVLNTAAQLSVVQQYWTGYAML